MPRPPSSEPPQEASAAVSDARVQALLAQAVERHRARQLDAAAALYREILAARPRLFDALHLSALIEVEAGRVEAGVRQLEAATAVQPDAAAAHNNLGIALAMLGRHAAAVTCFERAIALRPDLAQAHSGLADALAALGRHAPALAAYDRALALGPPSAELAYNRGNSLRRLGALEPALASYTQAVSLQPDFAKAHYNCGVTLTELGRPLQAIASYDRALRAQPDLAEAHANRGMALAELLQFDAALRDYDRAIALRPDHVEAHWARALALLTVGDLPAGWEAYEWRWRLPRAPRHRLAYSQPRWTGREPLAGRTLLLYGEQGLGDTLQFCRYARLAAQRGARVVLEVRRPLLRLLRPLEGVAELVEQGQPLPAFDYHCPLLSLPLAFGTTLDSIPAETAYLHADPDRVRAWGQRLGPPARPRVGLVWNGGFRPDQPEMHAVNARRNVPLEHMARLAALDLDFYSLQKGEPAESQLRGRERDVWPAGNLYNLTADLTDFAETAALIAHLDLVISVDTATAHLAAGMGKPTWILSRHDGCWRWLLDREDSPWYPSVRLYRQDAARSWEPVLDRVAADLAAWRPRSEGDTSTLVDGDITVLGSQLAKTAAKTA